ncbi:MAG: gamma-glutamylcyclotransferase family protein [Acidobacteriota bacterium]
MRGQENHDQVEWLFVYGTLMRGYPNHKLLKGYILSVEPAVMKGQIYHLPAGYPMAMTGPGLVQGEALQVQKPHKLWLELDRLEGYRGPGAIDNLYVRRQKEITLQATGLKITATVYLMPPGRREWVKQHGTAIKNGSWHDFVKNII